MALKPEISTMAALSTAALVYAIYNNATPPMADVRMSTPGSPEHNDVDAARKQAAWISAGAVGAIALVAKDPNIAIVGWGMTVALDWWHRYSNEINPIIGKVLPNAMQDGTAAQPADTIDYGPQLEVV
jgi:hypothetical protein